MQVCVQISYIPESRPDFTSFGALPVISSQTIYLAENASFELDVDELLFLNKAREAVGALVRNLAAHNVATKVVSLLTTRFILLKRESFSRLP